MFTVRPASRPVARTPPRSPSPRPPSPPKTNQQRQPSPAARGSRPQSPSQQPQRQHWRQPFTPIQGNGWQQANSNQGNGPQQTPAVGSGWQNARPGTQGSQKRPSREGTQSKTEGMVKLSYAGNSPQPALHPGNKHLEFIDGKYMVSWVKEDGSVRTKPAHGSYSYVVPVNDPSSILIRRDQNDAQTGEITSSGNKRKDWNNRRGHTSISGNQDVFYAGTVYFENGEMIFWDRASGHYKPGEDLDPSRRVQARFARSQTSLALKDDGTRMLPMNKFQNGAFEG